MLHVLACLSSLRHPLPYFPPSLHQPLPCCPRPVQVGCKQDPKKPVVAETYEELVFSEPREDFYHRIKNHQPSEFLCLQSPASAVGMEYVGFIIHGTDLTG